MLISGLRSCQMIYKNRPKDLIRLYVTEERLKSVRDIVSYLVKERLAYHVVTSAELEKITKSTHHEGVAILVKEKPSMGLDKLFPIKPKKSVLLAIEGVTNPHNIGAILRTAAHYGVNSLISVGEEITSSSALIRTSEGGFEFIQITNVKNIDELIKFATKYDFRIYSTSSHQGSDLYQTSLHERSIFLMGEEASGLEKSTLQKLHHHINIKGTGHVESLNVSVASSILLSEWWRQNQIVPKA